MALVYGIQERYGEALAAYEQALAIRREVGDQVGEGITLISKGAVYHAQGRYEKALEAYQQGMEILEAVRAVAGSEQGRASFIAKYAFSYASTIYLFHQQGQDETAFFTSERGRARAFLDSLATRQVQLTDNEAADLLAHEQATYAQRQTIQDALAQTRALDAPDPVLIADLEAQLVEAEAAYGEAQAAIEARRDQLVALVPGRSTLLDLAEVQALLEPQTTLLSYFVMETQTLVFLITADSFKVVELDISGEKLINQVVRFRDVIAFKKPDATRPVAQELYQLLIAPFADSLDTPRLAIVPHGPLHYLPFAALLNPETGRFLVQDYSLITLPSASALPFIRENAEAQGGRGAGEQEKNLSSAPPLLRTPALIIGNPTTGDFDATASLAVEREGLGALPFAEQEAQAIAALYGVEPLLGEDATEGAVRQDVVGADILHLAAHGAFNPVAPLSSLIALAPDDTYDGWLTVGEVYGLELSQTDLVVLSACQTQLGELSAGDEVVGLTRAFIFAGTPTVVASLWDVNDEATALLMERFYIHLKEGVGKAEALRQAQLELIEEGTHADPYYWSAFVMSGDGGEVREIPPIIVDIEEIEPTVSFIEAEDDTESAASEIPWGWFIAGGGFLVIAIVSSILWKRRNQRQDSQDIRVGE